KAQSLEGRGSLHRAVITRNPEGGDFVTRARRNDRCPCGSGKKYKKCCLAEHERRARAMRAEPQRATGEPRPVEIAVCSCCGRVDAHQDVGVVPPGVDGDALDELSNGVL